MSSTRTLAGGVAITVGLLITAGVASRGHPLGSHRALSGRTTEFLIAAAFCVAAALIVALAIDSHRPGSGARRRLGVGDVLFALALLAAVTAGSYGLGRVFHPSTSGKRHGVPCVKYEMSHGKPTTTCAKEAAPVVAQRARRTAHGVSDTSWPAAGAILALLIGGAALLRVGRPRLPAPTEPDSDRREAVVVALDLSIDDLRQEQDASRAIVAAYARMESALTAAGVARRPAEAPNEFLVRSLRELDASSGAASRLTELFVLAKFSQHHVTLEMRDEAIDALVAVRNEVATASS